MTLRQAWRYSAQIQLAADEGSTTATAQWIDVAADLLAGDSG